MDYEISIRDYLSMNRVEFVRALCQAKLSLVPIPPDNGKPTKAPKTPGWNRPRTAENPNGYSTNADDFFGMDSYNFGLHHGASNTLALDLDNVELALRIFKDLTDLQLLEWLENEQRVEVKSPKANRGKLLFKLPTGFGGAGLRQFKHEGKVIFELRSGNCQDVVIGQHPEGGNYQFIGNPAKIPEAPPVLLDMLVNWDKWKPCFTSVLDVKQTTPSIAPQRPQKGETIPHSRNPIREFNQAFSLQDILARNGYIQKGLGRFIRPGSESKAPGAVIMRNCSDGIERIYSHGGDVLNDGYAHDAFDCFRMLEHGGDWDKALAWNPDITRHKQRFFIQERVKNAKAAHQIVDGRQMQAAQRVPSLSTSSPTSLPGMDARDGTSNTRPLSELGNAMRLIDAYGENIRYVYDARAWIHWRDDSWVWDLDGAIINRLATELPAQVYSEGTLHLAESVHFYKWSRTSQKLRTIQASVALLSNSESIRLSMAMIDADLFKIGLDNGRMVIDLKMGKDRPAQQSDLITKSVNSKSLGNAAKAQLWNQFIHQIFNDNSELIDWFKRWCGYLLTGSTNEQIFVFCYGLGSNGKGVLSEMLRYLMGDYARAADIDTFTESKRQAGAASPDLADLIGARLAITSETEQGVALAEAKIKAITGNDTITTRKLHQNPVQFTPQFKLMVSGNHKPIIKGNDYGVWRRVRLIPFTRQFTEQDVDQNLLDKLKGESEHILAWMVEGCIEWQKHGLSDVPDVIKDATKEYQQEHDITGRWISECCELGQMYETSSSDMYTSYKNWCIANGLRPNSNISLGRRLADRGLDSRKSCGKMVWIGITIKESLSANDSAYTDDYRYAKEW